MLKIIKIITETDRPQSGIAKLVHDFDINNSNDDVTFHIGGSYKKLVSYDKQKENHWDELMLPANAFLESLPEEFQREVLLFFIKANQIISTNMYDQKSMNVSLEVIGDLLIELSNSKNSNMSLPTRLITFVKESGIPVPNLDKAMTEPHHTNSLTFKYVDYVNVIAISVLCKMICPIWGEIIHKTTSFISSDMKEIYCIKILDKLLRTSELDTIDSKFTNYLDNIINRRDNNDRSKFTASISGYSPVRVRKFIYATMLVKKLINIDLLKDDSDVMKYIDTCTKSSFSALSMTVNRGNNVMSRTELTESSGGDEESNTTHLEHSSKVSQIPADIPIIIEYGVNCHIEAVCKNYNISFDMFRDAVNYYRNNIVQVNSFNTTIAGLIIGPIIGGAKGLQYLNADTFCKLIVVTQIYLALSGKSALVNLLTCNTPNDKKDSALSTVGNRINMSYNQTIEYRNCIASFPNSIGDNSFVNVINSLKDFIILYDHKYNTAPMLFKLINQDIENGEDVYYDDEVVRDICRIILQVRNSQMPEEKIEE